MGGARAGSLLLVVAGACAIAAGCARGTLALAEERIVPDGGAAPDARVVQVAPLPEKLTWTAVSGAGPTPPWGPHVAVSGNGDALLVFETDAGVWAQRLERSSNSFTPLLRISGDRYGLAFPPAVAMDDHGNAIVAWTNGDFASRTVVARRFAVDAGWPSGWGPEETITDGDKSYLTRLTMTASGHAAVSWMRGPDAAAVAVFEAGRGWQPPAAFPCDEPYVLTIDSAIVEDGATLRVIAAGMAFDGTVNTSHIDGAVYRYDLGAHVGRFDAPVALLGKDVVEQDATAIGVDGAGNAMVGVFERIPADERFFEPYAGKVYVVRHTGAWGAPELIYDGPGRDPELAVSRSGDAMLSFLDHHTGAYEIRMRRTVSGAWQPAVTFPADAFAARRFGSFAVDGHGDVFAFFALFEAGAQASPVAVSRLGPREEWSTPARLPLAVGPDSVPRLLAIGPNGPAIAVAQRDPDSTGCEVARAAPGSE